MKATTTDKQRRQAAVLNFGQGVRSQEIFTGSGEEAGKRTSSSFYRGENVNFSPHRRDYDSADFLERYILQGWMTKEPLLTSETKITAFGSCFASHLTRHLMSIGYNTSKGRDPEIYISSIGEGLVNTYAILGQFEWAFENKHQPVDLWHGFDAKGYGYDERLRLRTRDVFLATEFFIITLGLSEIWYDEVTGGVFWRAVPLSAFDPNRHKFRVSTVDETKANLSAIYSLIRRYVPDAKVLFTLSPIPLAATFRPISCLTANSVSKAVLRAGLDEFLREHEADLRETLFYFPSYEILSHAFVDPWAPDGRHPVACAVQTILKTFEAVYCRTGITLADVGAQLQQCRAANLRRMLARPESEPDKESSKDHE